MKITLKDLLNNNKIKQLLNYLRIHEFSTREQIIKDHDNNKEISRIIELLLSREDIQEVLMLTPKGLMKSDGLNKHYPSSNIRKNTR